MSEEVYNNEPNKKFKICTIINIIFSIIFLVIIGILTVKASVLMV